MDNASAVDSIIVPASRDLGDGFTVRRALPSAKKRMVGPFVFFDQMGPASIDAGNGLDVRPHPHIGLATVTYLLQGELLHRDTLGTTQLIRPGELNWMTAGSGIAHSERTPVEARAQSSTLFGLQSWIALPEKDEEMQADFIHHGADALPVVEGEGKHVTVIVGTLFGAASPVVTRSAMVYADVRLAPSAAMAVPPIQEERAFYVIEGQVAVEGDRTFHPGELVVLRPGAVAVLTAGPTPCRFMLLGGEPLGPRYVWWNFVSSRKERIEQAKEDWRNERFGTIPGDAKERIPLPDKPMTEVKYP